MNSKTFLLILVAVAFTVSCGQQHKAQKTVDRFLDTYFANKEVIVEIVTFDSTRHLKPDVVEMLRQKAKSDRRFSASIQYVRAVDSQRMMPYSRVRLLEGTDTTYCTFYFDSQLEGVVCFKEN